MKVITIGRNNDNDIVVNDDRVSRNHLQIVQADNGNYSVVDLDSTNGTFVNGQRLTGEVRLQPNDVVKIGNTTLPWQSYFKAQPQTLMPPHPPIITTETKSKRTVWYIAATVALFLLVGSGIVFKVTGDKKQTKIELEKQTKLEEEIKNAETEATSARIAATQASEEAERAARKAAESKSESDKEIAKEKERIAKEKAVYASQKESEAQRYKAERDKALAAQQTAEKQSKQDSIERVRAERQAELAQETAREADRKRIDAETTLKLTREFFKVFPEIKTTKRIDYPQMICEKLGLMPTQGKEKKEYIEEQFSKADNEQKQKIINAIREVLGVQSNDERAEVDAKQDSAQRTTTPPPQPADTTNK
jgi:hypothetical protein